MMYQIFKLVISNIHIISRHSEMAFLSRETLKEGQCLEVHIVIMIRRCHKLKYMGCK